MVFSLAIKDGKAFFRNKFVQTKGFLAEQVRQKDQSFRLAVDYAMMLIGRWTILSCSLSSPAFPLRRLQESPCSAQRSLKALQMAADYSIPLTSPSRTLPTLVSSIGVENCLHCGR
jgi:hypothetical protein